MQVQYTCSRDHSHRTELPFLGLKRRSFTLQTGRLVTNSARRYRYTAIPLSLLFIPVRCTFLRDHMDRMESTLFLGMKRRRLTRRLMTIPVLRYRYTAIPLLLELLQLTIKRPMLAKCTYSAHRFLLRVRLRVRSRHPLLLSTSTAKSCCKTQPGGFCYSRISTSAARMKRSYRERHRCRRTKGIRTCG